MQSFRLTERRDVVCPGLTIRWVFSFVGLHGGERFDRRSVGDAPAEVKSCSGAGLVLWVESTRRALLTSYTTTRDTNERRDNPHVFLQKMGPFGCCFGMNLFSSAHHPNGV